MSYPASTGRNTAEVLRVLDSLQTGDANRVTTPINWTPGQDVIVHPSVSNDEAAKLFPGFRAVKPCPFICPLHDALTDRLARRSSIRYSARTEGVKGCMNTLNTFTILHTMCSSALQSPTCSSALLPVSPSCPATKASSELSSCRLSFRSALASLPLQPASRSLSHPTQLDCHHAA